MKSFFLQRKNWFSALSLLFLLVLLLAACSKNASSKPTSTAAAATSLTSSTSSTSPISTLSSTPTIKMGAQPCPDVVKTPAHWDPIIPIHRPGSQVRSVSCGYLMGTSTLQALITVDKGGSAAILDVYVFNNITAARPTRLFKLQGLVKGDAKISGYNTVLTAEVDQNSTLNAGKSSEQWTQDLFREFKWNAGEGTLVQVAFPGIFPDLTRYQAEADQANVNQGHQPWKNDPAQVAKVLVMQFLQWNRSLTTTVTSGGGPHDVYATVKVQEAPLQGAQSVGPFVNVTLSRLEGNTHNMWVVIAVADGQALSIENIDARSHVDNPVKIKGKGSAFEGVIGKALVLDHLYNDIGHAQVTGIPGIGMGNTTYSTMVLYSTSFHKGTQEGIVEVQQANGGISSEASSAVMVKVLLTPDLRVALGPLSGPDQLQKPGYWVPIIGVDTTKASVGTLSFANMKGDTSLQALVPVYHTDGSQIEDIYVYDRITSAHPAQLFKLQGIYRGGAIISGYSTILTAQVDKNSNVNKGKSADQLTTDLYREFKWSHGAGILAQTVFPAFYPDLTRYQAEVDQVKVNMGADPWKLDAAQTAKHFATSILKMNSSSSVSVVSGGGTHDLNAVVHVKLQLNGAGTFPPVKLTLSRLEGNINGGIWEVIAVESENMAITSPRSHERLDSPVTITGSGVAFEGQIGIVRVLDHLYNDIGHAFAMSQNTNSGFGPGTFTTPVKYNSSFHGGSQEGIVALYHQGGAQSDFGVVMLKVLVEA